MDWCLDICYCLFVGGFCFIYFFLVGGWGWFSLEFLGDKFYLTFFNFLKFFLFTFYFLLFCGGTLLIIFLHSLIHSHNFFVYWGEV